MPTLAQFKRALLKSKHLNEYKKGTVVSGGGKMSLLKNYSYILEENPGKNFDPGFKPYYSPEDMLKMGVFEGKYLNDCLDEFPYEWFHEAFNTGRLSLDKLDISCNWFGIKSRQPLYTWIENSWAPSIQSHHRSRPPYTKKRDILADPIGNPDERGWFQWYCRYWLGRRMPDLDSIQIARWRSFVRHVGAIRKGCDSKNYDCRRKERQALLQWAYNPFI